MGEGTSKIGFFLCEKQLYNVYLRVTEREKKGKRETTSDEIQVIGLFFSVARVFLPPRCLFRWFSVSFIDDHDHCSVLNGTT